MTDLVATLMARIEEIHLLVQRIEKERSAPSNNDRAGRIPHGGRRVRP